MNGDGKPDLVVENYDSDTLSVLLGNGDGTLRAKVDYATGDGPWSMAVGDVDHDGNVDVVTGNYFASTASVLLGNGDGTFKAKNDYTTGTGTNPESLRMGDVNGDGYLDIFTANASTNNVSILINRRNGTFRAPATFSTAAHPTFVDLSDLNGDAQAGPGDRQLHRRQRERAHGQRRRDLPGGGELRGERQSPDGPCRRLRPRRQARPLHGQLDVPTTRAS